MRTLFLILLWTPTFVAASELQPAFDAGTAVLLEQLEERLDRGEIDRALDLPVLIQLAEAARARGDAAGAERIAFLRTALDDPGMRLPASTTVGGSNLLFGRVLDEAGQPIANASLTAFVEGLFAGSRLSDADGRYEIGGLGQGTYTVRATAAGFRTEHWGDVYCPRDRCDSTSGATVLLDGSANSVAQLDFELDRGAGISGTVRDQSTGLPLADFEIQIQEDEGGSAFYATTDFHGRYLVTGLFAGTYKALTLGKYGYGGEVFAGRDCARDCYQVADLGDALALADRESKSGVDFGLLKLGEISGSVRLAGSLEPLAFGRVQFLRREDDQWLYEAATWVNEGVFRSPGLPPGNYFVAVTDSPGRLGQIYPGVDCQIPYSIPLPSCVATAARPITVDFLTARTGVDFSLVPGATVQGRVVDGEGGQPLDGALIHVVAPGEKPNTRTTLAMATTDEQGRFAIAGLAAGPVKLLASSDGFVSQIYPSLSCTHCLVGEGGLVALAKNETRSGLDFALVRPGGIETTVNDASTATPLPYLSYVLFDQMRRVPLTYYSTAGRLAVEGLAPGDYYLGVEADGHLPTVYGKGPVDGLDPETLVRGALIRVTAGSTTLLPSIVMPLGRQNFRATRRRRLLHRGAP